MTTTRQRARTRPTRAETRARLVAAAKELFLEQGPASTSLEEVAARAGLTKGAVYSSFASKDELILALVDELRVNSNDALFPSRRNAGGDLRKRFRRFGKAVYNAEQPEHVLAFNLELSALALRNRRVRPRLAEWFHRAFTDTAARVEARAGAQGETLGVDPIRLLVISQSLLEGLLLRRALNPELVDEELFATAFALLATLHADAAER